MAKTSTKFEPDATDPKDFSTNQELLEALGLLWNKDTPLRPVFSLLLISSGMFHYVLRVILNYNELELLTIIKILHLTCIYFLVCLSAFVALYQSQRFLGLAAVIKEGFHTYSQGLTQQQSDIRVRANEKILKITKYGMRFFVISTLGSTLKEPVPYDFEKWRHEYIGWIPFLVDSWPKPLEYPDKILVTIGCGAAALASLTFAHWWWLMDIILYLGIHFDAFGLVIGVVYLLCGTVSGQAEKRYFLSQIYHLMAALSAALLGGTVCIVFITIAEHLLAQLQILTISLRNALNDIPNSKDLNAKRQAYRRIRSCVQHHHTILRFFLQFQKYYSITLFSMLAGTTIAMCTIAYVITDPNSTFGVSAAFLSLMAPEIAFCVTYCTYGQWLTDRAFEVRDAVYNAPWYCQPKDVQLALLMILVKTRRPLTLSAAGLRDCSIKSIGEITQTTYTYFNALQIFRGKPTYKNI